MGRVIKFVKKICERERERERGTSKVCRRFFVSDRVVNADLIERVEFHTRGFRRGVGLRFVFKARDLERVNNSNNNPGGKKILPTRN